MKHSVHGLGLGILLLCAFQTVQAAALNLAVADSTCDAMKKVGELYNAKSPVQFNFICKSSGLLAKGMRGGALNADIFVSADREWMDFAIEHGLVAPEQVVSPWGNALVVASAKGSPLRFTDWQDLASDKIATILIGDPGTAPFGRYAKQALETSGVWERVKHKIETRKNISLLAESLEAANTATVGILFKTHLTGQLRAVHGVDKAWHPPIRYYLAPLKASAGQPEVARFLKFMQGRAAKAVFLAEGFDLPDD
jgi:molybdate transport system substrate-binding protein